MRSRDYQAEGRFRAGAGVRCLRCVRACSCGIVAIPPGTEVCLGRRARENRR